MSSYRSNYVHWKGGSGLGSTYSPASSTSSLASSTSTGGSSTSKYGSTLSTSSYKPDSKAPSREPSFVTSSSSLGLGGTGRLGSRLSALSAKLDSISSPLSGSLGASNLSSTSKVSSPCPLHAETKSNATTGSSSLGLASNISSLSSKFSSEPSGNAFRSTNSYLRTNTSAVTNKPETSPSITSKSIKPEEPKLLSSPGNVSTKASEEKTSGTSLSTNYGANSTTSSYRQYSTRATSDLSTFNATSITSSLRSTTTRFGLRSGHYNSVHPTASTLKAAEKLAEETKKEMLKAEKKIIKDSGPVSWMSRGTLTDSREKGDEATTIDEISNDETPSFEPRVYNPMYEGVLKHRGMQTDEEQKAKPSPSSSIPRPTLSLNYYSALGSSVGKYGAKTPQTNEKNETSTAEMQGSPTNSNPLSTRIKTRSGSVKREGSTSKASSTAPGTMTSGSDQSSRSSQQTINNQIAAESSRNNNEHETSPSIAKTTTNPTNEEGNNGSKESAGVVIAVPNKEFRKSALNSKADFGKKQEELRQQKSSKTPSTNAATLNNASQEPQANTNSGKGDKGSSSGTESTSSSEPNSSPLLRTGSKRDLLKRPPADPNKPSQSQSSSNQSVSMSDGPMNMNMNASSSQASISDQDSSKSKDKASIAKIAKTRSTNGINQLRKLSSASAGSDSESCSSLSSPSASTKGNDDSSNKKVKKMSLNNHNLENKGQGRRGSACSSTGSSRSNSVERSGQMNAGNNSANNKSNCSNLKTGSIINSNINLPLPSKPPSGPSSTRASDLPKPVAKSKSRKHVPDENKVSSSSKASTSNTPTAQTSFLDRTMGDRPWVRKCQSGELPWWMRSSPDVPSVLGKTPSKSNVTASASKADDDGESSSSEVSGDELEMDDDPKDDINIGEELGERTAPDGGEVPAETISPKSTLQSTKAEKPSGSRKGSSSGKDSLFICNIANIDDLLGKVSPSLLPETPSPAPTPTPTNAIDALCEAQRSLNLNKSHLDSESSSSSDIEDDLDKTKKVEELESEEESSDEDDDSTRTSSSFEEVDPCSVKIGGANQQQAQLHDKKSKPREKLSQSRRLSAAEDESKMIPQDQQKQLDDATLQLYKEGEFGPYLDLESSITEQQEDFEGFLDNRKNAIVLRAQLPVRVANIIEKLLTADGRELRRALFSLKQIFQEDKDLVHEFVENGGLNCLIKVGSQADQNYQNYILRAIGQVMLYVDGMYGVMRHNETIQWLYTLVASKFRLVQKTALKLLLVFVDYVETNCLLLVQAVAAVDHNKGLESWSNVMNLLREQDSNSGDTELIVYAMTLVNKVLNAIPDIDNYYDQVDALEEQGMANVIQSYMGKQCADLDLLKQFQIYELVLKHEDGEEDNIMMQLDENMRNKLLSRKADGESQNKDRRKSRRHSTSTPPTTPNGTIVPPFSNSRRLSSTDVSPYSSLSSSSSIGTLNGFLPNGHGKEKAANLELTPGLRRRRERADHQKNLILEQLVNVGGMNGDSSHYVDPESPVANPGSPEFISLRRSSGSKKDLNSLELQNNLKNSCNGTNGGSSAARPWMLPIYTKSNGMANSSSNVSNGGPPECENGDGTDSEKSLMQLKRENTVKDLTQKLASQNLLASPAEENKSFVASEELSGVVSKAKEGLAKSKSRADMKPQASDNANGMANSNKGVQLEVKKSDNELHWDFLVNNLSRPLEICDLDFTDLKTNDDEDILAPDPMLCNGLGFPPPAPMMMNGHPPPPPPNGVRFGGAAPPPPMNGLGLNSPLFGISLKTPLTPGGPQTPDANKISSNAKKTKKTVKLFWKEVREDPITASKVQKVGSTIWSEIQPSPVDTQKLEHLFESRAKDIINKKQSDANKAKEIVVLDPKRSNAINIGMTKLPPPRTIKAAILKMDSTIINREGIEKLLAMLPTEEERAKITEAQFANPEVPLGSAEQFLLTLSSISELTARLKLWAFKLDYENLEREVAEPLMDLKIGIEVLEKNKTFRYILATLLSIGNFLNGADAKGFQIEYLSKVPEVKDTVQKHSLLHHLCQTVNENFPDSTDLYSEIGPITRASRVDFDEIGTNLAKMESDCKTSWDHLRLIAKHDGPTNLKLKLSEFLADCAERIIVLGIIHRRIFNRFHKFLLWLGVSAHQVTTTKPHTLFKVISEFALEYRTTRERVIQQMQKKANHRERNKTRGKMITEVQIQQYESKEDQEDAELREVLNKTSCNGSDDVKASPLSWARRQKPPTTPTTPTTPYNSFSLNSRSSTLSSNGTLGDGDDEILESLVKTATRTSDTRVANRERKRNNGLTRNSADRKSLRRTLRHGLSEEERKMLAAFMASGHTFCS